MWYVHTAELMLLGYLFGINLRVLYDSPARTQIRCELILASINQVTGDILYTFKETFPRFILAEKNTHLIASKNTSSSRAIPSAKLMKKIINDPFIPYTFGTYAKGMKSGPPLTGFLRTVAQHAWLFARYPAVLAGLFCHYVLRLSKEVTNRLYEPWMWTEQVWSATDVKNELKLRNHFMAEPHYQILASQKAKIATLVEGLACLKDFPGIATARIPDLVTDEYKTVANKVQFLSPGEWHLPFVYPLNYRYTHWDIGSLKKISAGRCAWVSYFMPGPDSDKVDSEMAALATYAKLAENDPKHLSPLMHQGAALPESVRCGNFVGFLQFRKQIPNEAGGDKVVISVTPETAQSMLDTWIQAAAEHARIKATEAAQELANMEAA